MDSDSERSSCASRTGSLTGNPLVQADKSRYRIQFGYLDPSVVHFSLHSDHGSGKEDEIRHIVEKKRHFRLVFILDVKRGQQSDVKENIGVFEDGG